MKQLKVILVTLVSFMLIACGGGGTPQADPRLPATNAPTLALFIVDAAGAAVAGNTIGSGALFFVEARLRTSTGAPVANSLVSFTTDASIAVVAQSPVLTNASGVARTQISPVSLVDIKAGSLAASATVNGVTALASVNYQTSVADVPVSNAPTLALSIVDAAGVAVANNTIGSGALFFAEARLRTSTGAPLANSLVSFTTDSSVAIVAQSPVLTNASGVARTQISPASLLDVKAGNLAASATVNGVAALASVNYQTSVSDVPVTDAQTLALSIVDAAGNAAVGNAIGSGALFYAEARLRTSTGAPVANSLVSFTTDSSVAIVAQSPVLTNASGVARTQISPVSLLDIKAGTLAASAMVSGVTVLASMNYQTSVANVSLTNMQAAQGTISALQATEVTVQARVNGVVAGSGVLAINFSANCGSFSPASATPNYAGLVSTSYQSAASCSGPVTLTAQTAGAPVATTVVNVTVAKAANVVFSSATVPLMVSTAAIGGLRQSTLKFQVLDSQGGAMSGQALTFSLDPSSISAGVSFTVAGTTAPQAVTTDGNGEAVITVSAGSLPTAVIVTAVLASNPSVKASSSGVAVTSGRATQNAASLSATKLSIEGWNIDGVQTELTMRVADRQGNPVPPGATVNFVTGYGLVQGACVLDAASQCSVTYTSQGLRPASGRVAILAYMDGEESFIDNNGDNIWQPGETFFDVGLLYRDDNENGAFDAGLEQTYPGGATGTSACAVAAYAYPSVANTCDGTWSNTIRVRRQAVITLATSEANITLVAARTVSGFKVSVTDRKGNAMPTGTTVSAELVTAGATCTVVSVDPPVVRNSINGGNHVIGLDGAADCATVQINVIVTPPSGLATIISF